MTRKEYEALKPDIFDEDMRTDLEEAGWPMDELPTEYSQHSMSVAGANAFKWYAEHHPNPRSLASAENLSKKIHRSYMCYMIDVIRLLQTALHNQNVRIHEFFNYMQAMGLLEDEIEKITSHL